MVSHTTINLIKIYFIFVLLFNFGSCTDDYSDENPERYKGPTEPPKLSKKQLLIQQIHKKIANISYTAFYKATPEKKEDILKKIENKVKNAAAKFGPNADKYVKLIMEQVKSRVFNKNLRYANKPIGLRTKKEIIRDISKKIQTLAKVFLKHAKTIESKKNILEKIKRRIMDSTNQKHLQLHNKHDELKTYSSLIAEGIEASMQKMLAAENVQRRNNDMKAISQEMTSDKQKNTLVTNIAEIHKYKELILQSLKDTVVDPTCVKVVADICHKIQYSNKIPCGEGKVLPIENLCNGIADCVDKIDEMNCTDQAMRKVRDGIAVMADIEASFNRKCFATSDDHLLSEQNIFLQKMLNTQADLLNAVEHKEKLDEVYIRKTVNDVSIILSTLSYATDVSLCARTVDPNRLGDSELRRYNNIEVDNFEEEPPTKIWMPKTCRCKGENCKDSSCDDPCKRVCWQRYSLNHWTCQALSGYTSVSLDVICDGKLDCFDETDEASCAREGSLSKFEAVKTYNVLLDLVSDKSNSKELSRSRNKLNALHGLIIQLQKETVRTFTENHIIKNLRDETFAQLVAIYDDLIETRTLEDLDKNYEILLLVHNKLVSALKHSHTGNEYIISPEGCYCREGQCALLRCTKHCIQACLAEPLLTRYECEKNITVPIESICNGKKNCPNGEDEKDCTIEACRKHHLVILRNNLQNVGAKHTSTIIGEVITSWKDKVTAALLIAEAAPERLNHKRMVDKVGGVLHDLVMAFAAMEEFRRVNSETALKEFIDLSKVVMDALKSCSY